MRRLFLVLALGLLPGLATGSPADGQSLAARIAAAPAGGIVEVPTGVYPGPVIITKTVRLRGQPGATIEGDGLSHVVEIRAPGVEVSGFIIRRSGTDLARDHAGVYVAAADAVVQDNVIVDCLHGIYVKGADNGRFIGNVIRGRAEAEAIDDPLVSGLKLSPAELCSVTLGQNQRGNGIHLWKSSGHRIENNDIRGTRDGIYFSFTDRTLVRGNHIEQVRYGLHYMYSDENTFEDNLFTGNAAGAALMFSSHLVLRGNSFVANRSHRAYGLLIHSVDQTRVLNNLISGNTVGLYLEYNNGNEIAGNEIVSNYIGLRVSETSADNQFTGNRFARNLHPVESTGRNELNRWASDGRGNSWEGALRLDLDGNGVADVGHREVDLFGPWRRTFPAIGLLSGSPGERLMRFIYGRVPVRGLSGVEDPSPLVAVSLP